MPIAFSFGNRQLEIGNYKKGSFVAITKILNASFGLVTVLFIAAGLLTYFNFHPLAYVTLAVGIVVSIATMVSIVAKLGVNLEAAEQSEARARGVQDTAVDAIVVIDERGIVESINPAGERMFGYGKSEVVGQNVKMLMPSPFHEEHDGYLRNYRETGVKKVIGIGREVEGRHKNKSTFPIDLTVGEMQVGGRRLFTGIARDISDRKQIEVEREQLLARAHALQNTAVDAIIVIDEQGIIESINAAGVRIFGYDESEVLGKNVKMLMPSPFHEEHDGYLRNYRETGMKKVIGIGREVKGLRKNKSIFPIDLSVGEMKIGGRRLFTGIARDISERKQAELEAQDRLNKIIDGAPNGMLMIDSKGKIVLVNRVFEETFGYTRDELIGQPVEIFVPEQIRSQHPSLRDGFFARPEARSMGMGRDLFGVRKDRTQVPVEIGLSPVRLNGDTYALASIVDITLRKQAVTVIAESAAAIAAGDLTQPDLPVSKGEMGKVAAAFNSMSRSLKELLTQNQTLTGQLTSSSQQIATASQQQVSSLAESTASLNQISTTAEEFKTTIQEFGDRARAVQEAANETAKHAVEGRALAQRSAEQTEAVRDDARSAGETVLQFVDQMQRITDITDTVNEIAEQTKLLALNASIEAARAGEEGKGFAVVATQVRELANQSKEAAGNISTLISDTQRSLQSVVKQIEQGSRKSDETATMVNTLADRFEQMVAAFTQTADAMTQITGGALQQEESIVQLVLGLNELESASKQLAISAEQTQKSIADIDEQIGTLNQTMAKFKV